MRHRPCRDMRSVTKLVPIFSLGLLLSWLSTACVSHVNPSFSAYRIIRPNISAAEIRLEYNAENNWDARMISAAVEAAIPKATRWGPLENQVVISIYPTHDDLERAIRKPGVHWLRAWATYDHIHLQAPSTWGSGSLERRVNELIAHELTHVVMYQQVGNAKSWRTINIPLWFREGMASVTAGQAAGRLPRDVLAERLVALQFDGDPVLEADKIVNNHPQEVYSLGHWLFADLLELKGEAPIRAMLRGLRSGQSFREAWHKHLGDYMDTYIASWTERLVTHGAAGGANATASPPLL